ncbi:hypothetical protein IAT38_000024 [Cryptococcus sp. DSM 104549]
MPSIPASSSSSSSPARTNAHPTPASRPRPPSPQPIPLPTRSSSLPQSPPSPSNPYASSYSAAEAYPNTYFSNASLSADTPGSHSPSHARRDTRPSILRRLMKRNHTPTAAGYAVLAALGLVVLFFMQSGENTVGLLPSSWTAPQSQSDSLSPGGGGKHSWGSGSINDDVNDDAGVDGSWPTNSPPANEEDDELDNPPLPLLPKTYAPFYPSLTLPKSLLASPKLYPLASRLSQFLHRPILSHARAEEANNAGCPRELSDKLVNPDQYNGDGDFWRDEVTEEEIARRRVDIVNWLAETVEKGEDVLGVEGRTGSGRGIVLTGGNQDTTLRTITAIKHLRRLNVELPIEVFHYSDELTDQNQRNEIEDLGATLREARGLEKVAGVWKNWQIKGLALVQSSFRQIIYLDSDNTPLRSPTHLFDASLYTSSGRAVFWPDLSKDHPDNAIWRIIGDTCSLDLWTFESGQIVIDKAGNEGMNYAALIVAAGMMRDRDFWFRMCGGDKDTFRWAFRALGLDFGVSPRWMSALGVKNGFENDRFCGHSVLQYDLVTPDGFTRPPPLFVHSNLLKHLGGAGLSKGSLFRYIRRISNDYSHNPSLNHAHSFVYDGAMRGMCLDLDWHEDTPQEVREDEWIETVGVEEEEGGVFEGFETAWFDEGGRIGGW